MSSERVKADTWLRSHCKRSSPHGVHYMLYSAGGVKLQDRQQICYATLTICTSGATRVRLLPSNAGKKKGLLKAGLSQKYQEGVETYYSFILNSMFGKYYHRATAKSLVEGATVYFRNLPYELGLATLSIWRHPHEYPLAIVTMQKLIDRGMDTPTAIIASLVMCTAATTSSGKIIIRNYFACNHCPFALEHINTAQIEGLRKGVLRYEVKDTRTSLKKGRVGGIVSKLLWDCSVENKTYSYVMDFSAAMEGKNPFESYANMDKAVDIIFNKLKGLMK